MKKIILCLTLFLIGISSVNAQKTENNGKEEFNKGLISFINSVKPAFSSNGSTFDNFKEFLIGKENLKTITSQGDALLSKTYQLLSNNSSDEVLKTNLNQEFSDAMKFILENSKDDDIKNIGEKASVSLFGGNQEGLEKNNAQIMGKREGGCRWYQIGCHLGNLWDWIVDHAGGIKTVLGIMAYSAMFCYYSPIC